MEVTPLEGRLPRLAIDRAGQPHMAYQTFTPFLASQSQTFTIHYASKTAAGWSSETVVSTHGKLEALEFSFNPSGQPCILASNGANAPFLACRTDRWRFKELTRDKDLAALPWTDDLVSTSPGYGGFASFALPADGDPQVLYPGGNSVWWIRWSEKLESERVYTAQRDESEPSSAHLYAGPDGRVHATFFEQPADSRQWSSIYSGDLHYAVRTQLGWVTKIALRDQTRGHFVRIAADASSEHFLYSDLDPQMHRDHIVYATGGSLWDEHVFPDEVDMGVSEDQMALSLSAQGEPLVAFRNKVGVQHYRESRGGWSAEEVEAGGDFFDVSMAVDPGGGSHIAYAVITLSGGQGRYGRLHYAYRAAH